MIALLLLIMKSTELTLLALRGGGGEASGQRTEAVEEKKRLALDKVTRKRVCVKRDSRGGACQGKKQRGLSLDPGLLCT